MSGKSFPNMSLGIEPTAPLPLDSSESHSQTSYNPLTSENPTLFPRGPYRQHQSQYQTSSGFHGSSQFQARPSVDSMSSLGAPQSNAYHDFNQRTFLRETMRDNMGYNSVSNTFDSQNIASTSTNPSPVYDLEYSPSPVGDHPTRTSHLRYPVSRPASQQGSRLIQKPADAGPHSLHLLPPSGYYPSSLSHPMTYSPNDGQSAHAESQATELSNHVLSPFSHDHRSVENSPPVGPTSSFQALATSSGRLPSNSSRMVPSRLHLGSSSHSISQSPSIPMRKASSEWMTQNSFLPAPKHGVGISQKRYTSPAVAPGAHLQDAYLGAEARASDLPRPDAESYVDQSVKRMASPSVPSRPQASSHSASPAPLEGQSFEGPPPKKKKKSKMHACEICDKKFPRPSGLKTHMNTHNNARPYPCGFPGCNRTFGVRSNAKRHLRTHGVVPPPPGESSADAYVVGFSTPVIAPPPDHELDHVSEDAEDESSHRSSKVPFKLRWMPPSLTNRTNAASLKSVHETGEFSDDDGEDDEEDELRSGREPSRALSDVSGPHLSTSSGSSVTGSPDCSCTVPCGVSPCLSLIAAPLRPSSLQKIETLTEPAIGRVKDEHVRTSLQVDTLPSL